VELLKNEWLPGSGEEQMSRWSTEGFQDSETILEDTVLVCTCHYVLVHIPIMQHTKCDLEV
jgi:hypothetical protein